MSKLNPQKASAYVGSGVLRKGGKITKVPNGPLIKKKGPYPGSTLKSGGKIIKKAQNGDSLTVKKPMTYAEKRAAQEIVKQQNRDKLENILNRNAAAKGMTREEMSAWQKKNDRKPDDPGTGEKRGFGKEYVGCAGSERERARRLKEERNRKNGGPIKKAKAGGMIKRADGSYSKRGLWDNIRANKGSGKKPTKQMLVQEKKIKAKAKK